MKRHILLAVVIIGIFSLWFYSKHPLQTTVMIRNTKFIVDIAVTAKEKEVGLGGRDRLAADRGMLFVYDHKERYPFWMRNMRFPIDIIWIDDRTIVDITENVQPLTVPLEQLPLYHPIVPADTVLEINAGAADKHNIAVGDRVIIKN